MGSLEVVIRLIRPNFFVRICKGWKVGLPTILGLSTISPLIFGLTASTFLKIVAIGILAAYLRGKQKLIPSRIIDELSSENSYSVIFCNHQGLREADEMTRPYFGRGFIPFDRIEQWRLRNEKGFVQINNDEGVLCACFVILGLERSFFDQFIAGKVSEHDIDSTVILSFDEMKKEDRIYISGVVVRSPGSYMGAKRAKIMLWVILEYIKMVFRLRKTRTFYGIGLTKESEKLLKALGFQICCNKESRKDDSNLYRIDLDKKTWTTLLVKVGDLSKMVSFEIDF